MHAKVLPDTWQFHAGVGPAVVLAFHPCQKNDPITSLLSFRPAWNGVGPILDAAVHPFRRTESEAACLGPQWGDGAFEIGFYAAFGSRLAKSKAALRKIYTGIEVYTPLCWESSRIGLIQMGGMAAGQDSAKDVANGESVVAAAAAVFL